METENTKKLNRILEATKAILEFDSFDKTAKLIFDSCKELTGATSGYVALLNEDGSENELLFLDPGDLICTVDENLPMPIRGLREQAYKDKKVVYDNDFLNSQWTKFLPEGHVPMKNVLFAPLIIEQKVEGLIGLANKPTNFTEEDAETVASFGDLCAIALKNSRQLDIIKTNAKKIKFMNEGLKNINNILRHDVLNSIMSIEGALELYEEEEREKYISIMQNSVEKIKTLIHRMRELEFLELQSKPDILTNVSSICHEIADTYKNYDVEIEISGEATVLADHALASVIDNLINNSIKHSGTKKIECILSENKEQAEIIIKDYGIGLPANIKKKLEKRDSDVKLKKPSGLGLLIVRSTINRYNGRIIVEKNEPKGTIIKIIIPK